MPRKADHQARRALIADAVLRLAACRGLEAVSLRHVAAEAGVSTGMVQHYFRSKDEMMTFALGIVMDNAQARLTESADRTLTPREIVRTLLVQLLPLDDVRTREAYVALAFHAYAAVRPHVGADLRESTGHLRAHLADQIRTAQASSPTAAQLDPERAATGLLALAEGLGIHAIGGHYSTDEALAALEAHLDVVFGPST